MENKKYFIEKLRTNNENFPKSVSCIIKDKKGFMWFGTQYGLYRFDGYNFRVYLHKMDDINSISSDFITSICDDNDYLWIGTSSGLNRFDKITETFNTYNHDPNENSTISKGCVMKVSLSSNDELWVGTSNGLNKFSKATGKFIRYENNPEDLDATIGFNFVQTLFEDKEGYLWIGTYGGGLDVFDPKNNNFKHYKFDSEDSFSLSSDYVIDIIEDRQRNIWIATHDSGVNKFDKEKKSFYRYQHDPSNINSLIGNAVVSISEDKDGMLWFGCSEGISIFDSFKNKIINLHKYDNPLFLTDISCIYSDNTGIVWIGTSGEGGFSLYNESKWKFEHYTNIPRNNNSISSNLIESICEDGDGNIWVGNDSTGIDILNKNTGDFIHLVNDPNDSFTLGNNSISYIYKDNKNYMWVATDGGPLERYDPETKTFTHYFDFDGKVFYSPCIFEDKKENLWVGLKSGGIRVFDKSRVLKKKYTNDENGFAGLSNIHIYKIYEDSRGHVWIATDRGLAMLDPKIDKIIFYRNDPEDLNTLSYNSVGDICEDKKGFLWITTLGGLDKFDTNTKSFKHFTEENGLANNAVFGILLDEKERLWLSLYKGISVFDPEKETFINYDLDEGVQGSRFFAKSSYKSKDGKMFFGGENGFNGFYPKEITINNNVPTIVLTAFKIFDKEVKLKKSITETKEIKISYNENCFSFDFAALDYTNPSKNQYAYMLEGVDNDWNIDGSTRTVNYKNIEPGKYVFKVKGSNNDGVWNEEGVSVKLIISPPWNETLWFKGLKALSVLGVVGLIFRKRFEKINKERRQQEEFSRKLIESQENDRKRIAAELHDSLGQDLVIIKNKALINIKKTDDPKVKEQMIEISNLTTSTINEVREISYNLRPYELDRLGLIKTLQSLVDRASKSTNINFICDIDNIDNIFAPEIEINIYRIIQECLTNIIKHSEATKVIVYLKKLEKEISILISDNGKGFDAENKLSDSQRKGFGLKGIPERVKLFGGSIKIESSPGKGTVIKISLPFKS